MSHVLEDKHTTPKSGISSASHLARGEIFPSENLQQRLAGVLVQLDLPYNPSIHLSLYQVKYFQLLYSHADLKPHSLAQQKVIPVAPNSGGLCQQFQMCIQIPITATGG